MKKENEINQKLNQINTEMAKNNDEISETIEDYMQGGVYFIPDEIQNEVKELKKKNNDLEKNKKELLAFPTRETIEKEKGELEEQLKDVKEDLEPYMQGGIYAPTEEMLELLDKQKEIKQQIAEKDEILSIINEIEINEKEVDELDELNKEIREDYMQGGVYFIPDEVQNEIKENETKIEENKAKIEELYKKLEEYAKVRLEKNLTNQEKKSVNSNEKSTKKENQKENQKEEKKGQEKVDIDDIKNKLEKEIDRINKEKEKSDFQPPEVVSEKDKFQPPAVVGNKLRVTINAKTGKYQLIDENGKTSTITMDMDKKLLGRKGRKNFVNDLMEKHEKFANLNNIEEEDMKLICSYVDPNLYKLYEEYDRQNNTNLCENYIKAIDSEKIDDMPTKVTYDLRKRTNQEKEGIRAPIAKARLAKIAKEHEKFNLVEVLRDPKMKAWKKVLIGLGIAGGAAAITAGITKTDKQPDKPQNQIEEQTPDEPEKDDKEIDVTQDPIIGEVPDQNINYDEKQELGVGSEITLKDGTYYYDSEGSKPTGKIENRNNGEPVKVKINMIATVKDGLYQNVDFENSLEQIKKENPGCEIQVHIEDSKGGDLGWMSESELRKNMVEQEKTQEKEDIRSRIKVENSGNKIEATALEKFVEGVPEQKEFTTEISEQGEYTVDNTEQGR